MTNRANLIRIHSDVLFQTIQMMLSNTPEVEDEVYQTGKLQHSKNDPRHPTFFVNDYIRWEDMDWLKVESQLESRCLVG